jgi:dTDP-4-amino-4,6-dideoxygalactose transaminase
MLLVSAPIVGSREKTALSDVVDSGWLTMGARVNAFEEAFARMHEAEDCVAVSSCTAALHLSLLALGIGPGDEVLVPSMTFVATVNAVLYVGATPVFVDIDSFDVPLMSLAEAEARRTSRTKAVILVHYAGYLADREAWRAFAERRGLLLIEDAAHAPGVPDVGKFGDAAAFSFYGNKNMTTAEGGAVIARDRAVRDAVRQARNHGMTSNAHQRLNSRSPEYDVTSFGFNYRMDELRAAIGLVQLQNLREWNEIRRRAAAHYRPQLAQRCSDVLVPFSQPRISSHHIMPILLPNGVSRRRVIDRLLSQDIQTTIHYPPVHKLSFYKERFPDVHLPKTESFARRELTLPLHAEVSTTAVEAVVDALESSLSEGSDAGAAA